MSADSHLQQAVMTELHWEPSVVAAHLGVTAKAGVVTLTGHVETYAAKHAAETAARRVKGVLAVAQEIVVRLAPDVSRDDDAIAEAALDRLSWDVSIPRDAVTVRVEKGWVTLMGEVDQWFQKDAADQDVRRLWGVTGVSNQVTIKKSVDATLVSDDIMHALHRSWFFDPNTIKVHTTGGTIRLSGTAHSPHDRQVAAETAWSAPGATSVENDISIA